MHLLMSLRYVAAGGALGALLRWGALEAAGDERSVAVVMVLNTIGSLLLGVLVGRNLTRSRTRRITENQYLLLGTGFCGALTTFSSYTVEVARALDAGELARAGTVGFATPILAVLLAGVGYRIGSLR
jgi:CrcB protein